MLNTSYSCDSRRARADSAGSRRIAPATVGQRRARSLLGVLLGLVLAAPGAQAQNLLANADFEFGPPDFHDAFGFYTEYVEWPVSARGAFSVRSNPNTWNGFFPPCADHTPGAGVKMMCLDGDTHLVAWAEELHNLEPNTVYSFSFWWLNLYPDNPAIIRVRFRPEPGENWQYYTEPPWEYLTLPTDCVWHQVQQCWYSGPFTNMTIVVENVQSGETGADFALDDMDFRKSLCTAPPVIVSNPPPVQYSHAGGSANFSVTTGFSCLVPTYQWRHKGVPLSDGPTGYGSTISGAKTSSMDISKLRFQDIGEYDCVVTNSCGSTVSGVSSLSFLSVFHF